jgi:hypothetical protein
VGNFPAGPILFWTNIARRVITTILSWEFLS